MEVVGQLTTFIYRVFILSIPLSAEHFFSLHLSTKNLEEQLEIILKSKKNTSTHLIFRCIVIFQHVRLLGLFALDDDDDENDL